MFSATSVFLGHMLLSHIQQKQILFFHPLFKVSRLILNLFVNYIVVYGRKSVLQFLMSAAYRTVGFVALLSSEVG